MNIATNEYMLNVLPPLEPNIKSFNPYERTLNTDTSFKFPNKQTESYQTQISDNTLYKSLIGSDNNNYGNSWNVVIKPKAQFDAFGLKLL